jgi:hypothetical protein
MLRERQIPQGGCFLGSAGIHAVDRGAGGLFNQGRQHWGLRRADREECNEQQGPCCPGCRVCSLIGFQNWCRHCPSSRVSGAAIDLALCRSNFTILQTVEVFASCLAPMRQAIPTGRPTL